MFRSSAAARRASASRRPSGRPLQFEPLESRNLLAASITPLSVPQLSSRPGAAATLYLDFDGNVEKQWGSHTNVVTTPYDTDGNKASFSAAELAAIREIWARVAEDYAPFNLNVTTVAPPVIADRVAARVAIGGSYSDWYGSTAGGVSYVGRFAGGASNVAYVFANTLGSGNPRYVAEAASHEAGHLFGLEHQATWNSGQLVSEYSAGTAALAPIMGVSYYADRTTWANGPTTDGPTAAQDDLSLIASSANGFGYVPDDYGSTIATAAALPVGGASISLAGLIGRNNDRDVFKFTTGGGQVSFSLNVGQYGANLDGVLELQNATGQTLVAANPANSFGASLMTTVAAGTYYLVVHSSGGYGDLGRYTLHGNIAAATTTPGSQPQPPTSPPQDQPEGESTPPPVTTTSRIVDDGTATFASAGSWNKLTGIGYASDTQWSAAGSGGTSTWTFAGLAPGQYRVAATWSGSALNAVDAPFSVSGGSRLLSTVRVNQQRAASTFASDGATWQNLGTFTITGNTLTVRLNGSASGRVVADAIRLERVYSTSGGSVPSQAEIAAAIGATEFMTPLGPPANKPLHRSPVSVVAVTADNFLQPAEPWSPIAGQCGSESALHAAQDDRADALSPPAVDAALADVHLVDEALG